VVSTRVAVARVVASGGGADALLSTVGKDVRVSAAAAGAAAAAAAGSLAKRLITLFTFVRTLKTCWSNLSYCYTLTDSQFDLEPH
jgi:hypothetical protein